MRGSVRDSVSFGFVGRLSILATRQVCKLQSRVYFWTRSFNFFPSLFLSFFWTGEKKIRQGDTVQQKQSRINIRLYIKRDVLRFRIDVSH